MENIHHKSHSYVSPGTYEPCEVTDLHILAKNVDPPVDSVYSVLHISNAKGVYTQGD